MRAWEAEKMSVTLVSMPSSVRIFVAAKPSGVHGILIITFSGRSALSARPCSTIPAVSMAVTSAEIGPEQMPAISRTTSLKSRPDFLISEGLVVTPSRIPHAAISRISSTSAVSRKNSMVLVPTRDSMNSPLRSEPPIFTCVRWLAWLPRRCMVPKFP